MKSIQTVTGDQLIAETAPEGLSLGPAVALPIEIYGEKRIAEFDAVEADLDKVLPEMAGAGFVSPRKDHRA